MFLVNHLLLYSPAGAEGLAGLGQDVLEEYLAEDLWGIDDLSLAGHRPAPAQFGNPSLDAVPRPDAHAPPLVQLVTVAGPAQGPDSLTVMVIEHRLMLVCPAPPPPPETGYSPVSGTADPRSSQTGQVIRGLR